MTEELKKRLFYIKYILGIKKSVFYKRSHDSIFNYIYDTNYWKDGESRSGPGSTIQQTRLVRQFLEHIIVKLKISSIVDAPCGDHNWMKKLDLDNIIYHGFDIVPDLINKNNKNFKTSKRKFSVLDVTKNVIPKCDLIICRDLLTHLSMNDVSKTLANFVASNSKYLLITSYDLRRFNFDIHSGDWRPLNFRISPFNFPKCKIKLNEKSTEADGIFRDKCLLLFEIDSIRPYINQFKTSKLKSIVHVLTTPWLDLKPLSCIKKN